MRATLILVALTLTVGCGRSPAPSGEPAKATSATETSAPPKSAVSTVVDGLTGKTAVDAGRKARAQLEQIGKREQEDLTQAMQQ